MNPFIILSAAQMRAAEAAEIAAGTASAALMEIAGEKTVAVITQSFSQRPVAVICGPGNNGGDGFVIARELAQTGWPVKVALLGSLAALKGDAKLMADLYDGEVTAFSPETLDGAGLIIDAIFGTGLSRAVAGEAKAAIEAMNAHPAPIIAVDIPSGVDADTGSVLGAAIQAVRTVTFHARKPGHTLFPGRALSGAIDIADIGISDEATQRAGVGAFENHPALWGGTYPRPQWSKHKYQRGAVMVLSGGALNTGAARLAAQGALRVGAGLVTMLSPTAAAPTHAAHLTAIMLRIADSADHIRTHLADAERIRMVCVAGPALGVGAPTKEKVLAVLNSKAGAVLDADALTSFADAPSELFATLRHDDVLTPHGGEFARLFADEMKTGGKLEAARAASRKAGCVVVLKGADTVIAAPDGRALINTNAPPDLATAGSGDVLAGFIAGLKAQGLDGFAAAGQGVWVHGACGQVIGAGLIAEDLPQAVPAVLRQLFAPPQQSELQANRGEEGGAQQ